MYCCCRCHRTEHRKCMFVCLFACVCVCYTQHFGNVIRCSVPLDGSRYFVAVAAIVIVFVGLLLAVVYSTVTKLTVSATTKHSSAINRVRPNERVGRREKNKTANNESIALQTMTEHGITTQHSSSSSNGKYLYIFCV